MWEFLPPRIRLRGALQVPPSIGRALEADYARLCAGLPRPLEPYVLSAYGLDLASEYGGQRVKNPFGKASGQLSLALHQIEKDAEGGLGFVILKTLIAQDRAGAQSMREWAIPETRMLVERLRGRGGAEGWTVTWKGRGWFDTFGAYLRLFDEGLDAGRAQGMAVIPSVKYHLPTPQENFWREEEYSFTTAALLDVWRKRRGDEPMPLEKDFSPTLAGSERATQQAKILEWLARVPGLIHGAAPGRVRIGLKIFNALFDDCFQAQMLEAVHAVSPGEARADFLVYANRLFDPAKSFEGKTGVAYGGPDLSDRNLAALERFLDKAAGAGAALLPVSATGDIHSGRIAAEYLLRGASTFQMHTLFQLPDGEFEMRAGGKTEKALHRLLFHPAEGFIAWFASLGARFGWKPGTSVGQAAAWCRANWARVAAELEPAPPTVKPK